MASSNINKIVQSNFNLKPWVLSKNTTEIVNTYIQNMYKQMPNNFRRGLKAEKVASPRPENLGPIRAYKNEERLRPLSRLTFTAQQTPIRKPSKSNTTRLNESNLVKSVKASNENNIKLSNKIAGVTLTNSKKLLKSPNYKIYKSRRFGSSANSSRSSIIRRNDERKRQRLNYNPQVNYLAHSFNSSQFEGTYAKYLIPLRNQHVENHLGSLAHAKRISEDIQNDLMKIDTQTRGRIAVPSNNPTNAPETKDRLSVWNHPPSFDLYRKPETINYATKNNSWVGFESRKITRLSPENRDASGVSSSRPSQRLKPATPPTEQQFTSKLDLNRTEMQENHRRNRMKKLGLLQDSPVQTECEAEETAASAESQKALDGNNVSCEFKMKWTPNIASHMEAKDMVENRSPIRNYSSKFQSRLSPPNSPQGMRHSEDKQPSSPPSPQHQASKIPKIDHKNARLAKNEPITTKSSTPTNPEVSNPTTNFISSYSSTGPAAAARAQLTHNSNINHRYNSHDFFSPRKY